MEDITKKTKNQRKGEIFVVDMAYLMEDTDFMTGNGRNEMLIGEKVDNIMSVNGAEKILAEVPKKAKPYKNNVVFKRMLDTFFRVCELKNCACTILWK
jgi:hypothetical protein